MLAMFIILGVGIFAVVLDGVANTEHAQVVLSRFGGVKTHFPKAISMMLMLAQVSELSRAMQGTEHISLLAIIATVIFFTIWIATKSNMEL